MRPTTWLTAAALPLLGAAVACRASSLRFARPALLPMGNGPFFDYVQGVTDTSALGGSPRGFIATHDKGATWQVPPLAAVQSAGPGTPWQNFTTFAIKSATNASMHNMGGIEGHGLLNVTSVGGNASGLFWLDGKGRFASGVSNTPISFAGMPAPGITGFRLGGADWVRLGDGKTLLASIILTWAGLGKRASIAAFRSTDGGFTWRFVAHIARADKVASNEGPNENSLALLRNGSVLCVMRLDAGDAGRYHRYGRSVSNDHGQTWSPPTLMPMGAARPRLLAVGASLLLSGGRSWNKNRDTFVWFNALGDGELWVAYSLSYWHNHFITNKTEQFDPTATNASSKWPRESNSYSALVRTGASTAFVTYGLKGAYGFAMPIQLVGA